MLVERPCPTCGAENQGAAPSVASNPPAEAIGSEELKSRWAGFFRDKVFFSYVRCGQCALLYCPSYLSADSVGDFYGHMADNTAGLDVETVARTQREYLDVLGTGALLGGNYLELGPDIGLFTRVILGAGTFDTVTLVEPNLAVHDALAAALPHDRVRIWDDTARLEGLDDESIDLVVMIHVVDHLVDVADTLALLRKKVRRGGLLLAVTHDESSLLAKALKTRWPPYCLQHPQLYRGATMAKTLFPAGFEVVKVVKTRNHFPLGYLLEHAAWALGKRRVRLPVPTGVVVPLRLGNIATLARAC